MSHVAEYLAGLPKGLRSYPHAQCRAKVVENFVDEDTERVAAFVPDALRALVLRPPNPLSWVPEVHAQTVFAAVREGVSKSDDEFVERARFFNRRILSSPLYSLSRLVTLSRLAKTVASAWALAHRGSPLDIVEVGPTDMKLHMSYPDGLYTDCIIRAFLTAAEETLKVGGVYEVRSTLLEVTPGAFHARLCWTTRP